MLYFLFGLLVSQILVALFPSFAVKYCQFMLDREKALWKKIKEFFKRK